MIGFAGEVQEESELLKKLVDQGVRVASFVRQTGSLEQLFLKITGKQEVLS